MNNYIDEVIADFDRKFSKGLAELEIMAAVKPTQINVASNAIKSFLTKALTEQERRIKEDIAAVIDSKFTVYYRSKFSQDCSRQETEAEKNTEMIALSDIKFLLTPLPSKE